MGWVGGSERREREESKRGRGGEMRRWRREGE